MSARLPAKKVRIADLLNGKFFYGSKEEMKPSYVITPFGEKVSRVNLIGTVIDKFLSEDGNYSVVTIDDGTEAIRVKSFEGLPFERVELGDLVRVIGKLKEYNGELYISHEIVEKINDVNFELLSKVEILNNLIKQKKIVDDIKSLFNRMDENELKNYARDTYSIDEETLSVIIESKKKEIDYKPVVLEVIQKLDEGKGVEIK
ncbi:MAG: OB-fold nucleic acid binding domain-containing protein, partial [Candidatus Aenigmatarchaeota archaeon]